MSEKIYTLPPLPYEAADLEPVYAREIVELHHDKHHAAYVAGANQALADLAEARGTGNFSHIGELKKNLAFNISGHVLHSLFWCNLTPDGAGRPRQVLDRVLERDFGGFDRFRQEMTAAALTIQGSGWAALCWEPAGGRLVVEQIYDHQGNTASASTPLLALDMWEHAYYLQYRNDKKQWAKAFWDIVNWADVEQRYAAASEQQLLLAGESRKRAMASTTSRSDRQQQRASEQSTSGSAPV